MKDLLHIWKMEMNIILHDQGVFIFCILVPFGYPLLYSYIYTTELMRDVPITVVDQDHTPLSREFTRRVDASQWVRVVGNSTNIDDANLQIKKQKTYGYLVIPQDFSKNIQRGKQSFVGMYSDMGGLLYYKGILIAATDVSLEMNSHIKIEQAGYSTARSEAITDYPVTNKEVTLFNPQQGFASFLIPAVLMLIIQQTLLIGIGMAGGTAAERHEYKKLIATSRHNRGTMHIITGRGLAYFFVYCISTAYITCAVPLIFQLTQISHAGDLVIFMIPYILDCIFFAQTLSILMRNREISILVFVITSVPLLFISGVSWPGSAVPAFLKGVSWLFPSTFGINGFVRINTMGASISQVLPELIAICIQTVVYFVLSYFSCRVIIYFERKRDLQKYFSERARTKSASV